jgi:adenylate cyclase class IV
MKISGSKIKQVDRFTYLRSMVEKNGKIHNEINIRIRKATKFYNLIKEILWNKDT